MNYLHLNIPDICGYNVKYYYSNKVTEENPKNWMPHLHDTLELYVLIEGDVSFAVEGTNYKLTPGDAIITKPNEMHNCILNTRSVHRHLCFWFDAESSFIFEEFLKHDFGKNNLIRPSAEAHSRLLEIYDSLIVKEKEKDTHAQFYLTLEMLGILRKFINSENVLSEQGTVFDKILSDINKNFKAIKNLDYFTAKYYVSQSTLNRLFKTNLNTTPKHYLEMKKLAYSRKLLKEGKTVNEACAESGFADASNYIRLFKKRFEKTPGDYREKSLE